MILFTNLPAIKHKTAFTIGSYDGLHLGHLKILSSLKTRHKYKTCVITFKNHPDCYLKKATSFPLISINTKIELIRNMNIDYLVMLDFPKIADISAQNFLEMLSHKINIKKIYVGYNFRFGRKNTGDIEFLKKNTKVFNYELMVVNPVKDSQTKKIISSSLIRKCIIEGDMETSNRMLGRNYSVEGFVIKGEGVGKTLGYPTINISPEKIFLPKTGVYKTKTIYKKKVFNSMSDVGYKPTFHDCSRELFFETNIFNFNEKIYNQPVKIEFIKKIREDKKFKTPEELSKQLAIDRLKAQF